MKAEFFSGAKPRLLAHRGGSLRAPENTLAALREAYRLGMRYAEVDVRLTRDGRAVVIHDATLDRTTDGSGRVGERTLDEIKQLDGGYRFSTDGGGTHPYRGRGVTVPSLAEVLGDGLGLKLVVEIKPAQPGAAEAVVAEVRRSGREGDLLLASADHAILERVRRL